MPTGAKKHTHKYFMDSDTKLWNCGLSDCTHFMPKNVARNIHGKLSICWQCEKEFELDADALLMQQPQCLSCRNQSKSALKDMTEFLKEKGLV